VILPFSVSLEKTKKNENFTPSPKDSQLLSKFSKKNSMFDVSNKEAWNLSLISNCCNPRFLESQKNGAGWCGGGFRLAVLRVGSFFFQSAQ